MSELADVIGGVAGNGTPVVHVRGEIDLSNAEDVETRLHGYVVATAPGLVVDLSELDYLDSAGIRLLLRLAERLVGKQQRLRLVVPEAAAVQRVLLVAGLDSVVPIDASVEDAIARMTG